ncbi:MAG: NAD(P)-dependent oxidoreductase [Rhodospirillaceae bacterium]|nr:NAD(P)-dependent oxidoreductase [Rhodospirillaceae bacterium]
MADEQQVRVGFIGLGKMGAGICANVQQAGFPLTVYNRTASKTERFTEAGAVAARSPRELAERSDLVLSCLIDDASVLQNVQGEDGILAGLSEGGVHVCCATISPGASGEFEALHQAAGAHYVAAPVGGRPDAAEAGELISFVAGDPAGVERATPVINSYSERLVPLGESASVANVMKVVANYMGLVQLSMMSEMFAFAEKSGLNAMFVEMMLHMMYGAGPMKEYATRIRNRDFDESGFDMTGGFKDALIFEKAFDDAGVHPATMLAGKDKMRLAMANGLGDRDWAAMYEAVRLASGLDSLAGTGSGSE